MAADDSGSKKIGGVNSSTKAHSVEKTGQVDGVRSVQGASSVAGLSSTEGVNNRQRRATRSLSAEEREQLLKSIDEEAEKLFAGNIVPESKKILISSAVKMAVDASIVLDEDLKDEDKQD